MAAGLGFKDFQTGEVLTAADVDGYLMQGIWVFDDAAARDAAVTSPEEGNACYLKDTNEVLTYSGSVWVAVGGGSPLTTKGDLYTFSTVDARLAVGANDTVLTADSAEATGLKWATPAAGGMTLISTTTLTGASVSLTSIPQTYTDLRLVIRDFYPATNDATIVMTFNADTSGNYTYVRTRSTSTSVSENAGASNFPFNDRSTQQTNTDTNARAVVNIYDYATALDQVSDGIFVYFTTGSVTAVVTFGLTYFPSTSAAITSIELAPNSGNFGGGTALLYGVK